MTTIYTIEITPHVDITAGTMPLKVSAKPVIFCFNTVEARQPIFDLAKRMGWVHRTDVFTTTTAATACNLLQRDIDNLIVELRLHPKPLTLEP
jgi:hypothetical protein